jgi:predicted transcriptional regulator
MKPVHLEKRHHDILALLMEGKSLSAARQELQLADPTFQQGVSIVMMALKQHIGLTWQECVIREYLRQLRSTPATRLTETESANKYPLQGELHDIALQEFLQSKDAELQQMAQLNQNFTARLPKVSATNA